MIDNEPLTIAKLLGPDAPSNWGKWGPDDEVGSLNYLTPAEALRGVSAIRTGESFTLQAPIGLPGVEDPVWPNRTGAVRTAVADDGFFTRGEIPEPSDTHRWADDKIEMFLQGSTQYDALGHLWYDDKIWNGYDASTTVGRLEKASVLPIAERGVVGHGVLIDMARHREVESLSPGDTFTHDDVLEAAKTQGVVISPRDVLLIRTGRLGQYYRTSAEEYYRDWNEPGLTYTRELVEWFQAMQIPNLVTDLIANEATLYPGTELELPLHCALMRNLGIAFTEIVWLDDLAAACAADGRWTFLYTAAPLKVHGASGAPVNPIAIR
jgi:kynurenine formamidase